MCSAKVEETLVYTSGSGKQSVKSEDNVSVRSLSPEKYRVNYKKALSALQLATPRSQANTPRTINDDVRGCKSEISQRSKSCRQGSTTSSPEERQELTFPANRRWDIARENDRLLKRLMEIKSKGSNKSPWNQPHVISRHYIDSHTTSIRANERKKMKVKQAKSEAVLDDWEF